MQSAPPSAARPPHPPGSPEGTPPVTGAGVRNSGLPRPSGWGILWTLLLSLGLGTLSGSCRASDPSQRLQQLYAQREAEVAGERGPVTEQVEKRAREARRIVESSEELNSTDQLFAALLLYDSRVLENVMLARDMALHAVEMGDPRGLPIAAEAEDIELMLRGAPQRYGTQYVYDTVGKRWALYPVNPLTSDSERAAMGVASLAEAQHRVDVLNSQIQHIPQSLQ